MRKQYANLTAAQNADGWYVDDTEGGRWFPSDDAEQEIETSDNPEMTAKRICDEEPMRGTWKQ